MADDTTPNVKIDVLDARVDAFRAQPDAKTFDQLRQELRRAGRGDLLAELCATWAQRERDPVRAADAWSEAGEALAVIGEVETAVDYLRSALDLDPANERAADRLLELVQDHDPAAAVEVIELQLGELSKRPGGQGARAKADVAARSAALHRRAAELWDVHLGRVDRALWHWQQAWKLEPQRTEALDAARTLYGSLGEHAMVAKLYQAELDVLGNAPAAAPRKAAIRFELGKLALRAKDLEAAANHLEEAARLDPSSLEIAEKLADVYASPGFRGGQTASKAGQLFVELGKKRLKTRDDATGINYLRRAVGVDPYSKGSSDALQEALQAHNEWAELDRILRHRSAVAQDPAERAEVLRRRAALYRTQMPNRAALIEVLTELVAYEQPGSKPARELRELLRDDQDWEALSRLMEAEINALGQNPNTPSNVLVAELLELATVAREHMGDRDRAAELLHQALGVDPMHEEALARYVDHFRERRDWRGLVELQEFALDNVRDAGAPPDEQVRRLEEIAQLAELRMGDIDRALDAWGRIARLEPDSPKVAEANRRLTARSKMWQQLVASLEDEVARAGDPVSRIHAIKKMAQTFRERQIDPRRAIDLYEQVLAENPDDEATQKALADLYEREGDDAGLARTIRRGLDLEERRVVDAMRRAGKSTDGAKDWPVAKRAERLSQLRRLAALYETRLADVDGVVFASRGVLDLLSGDRDALERMERVLEKANDPRLEQTLEYHAAASSSPNERAKLLKRLAKLAVARDDDFAALDRWEQTLRASPSDPDALAALAALYEKVERWAELAQILERIDGGSSGRSALPATGTPEAALKGLELERYATVVDTHLHDSARAIKAWHRVLELLPRHRVAQAALARLYRAAGKWRELADALGAQVATFSQQVAPGDLDNACQIAMERAELFEERLGAPAEAIKVLEHVLRELNPNHLDAHTALRRLHEARGDFDAAVRIAEREMYLSPEPERKIARGLEIGLVCRDRLNNPTRALQAFKRVLELDAEQDEALAAAADLLARLGRWKEHVQMLERMLVLSPADERRTLVQRIASATADKLDDAKGAFRWWRRAYDEAPDDATLADVRRAAEAYGLWRELAEVLGEERKRVAGIDTDRYVGLSRELAGVYERRLGDKPRAMATLAEALAVVPRLGLLLAELDRLASELDQKPAWKALLDAYAVALPAAAPAERVDLYLRRAKLLEERTHDTKGAVADVLAAFSWAPEREDIRDTLVSLAGKARAWADVVAVDSALVERAPTTARRVELLRRKAQVIEEQLKDAPRAFRTHLIALLLDPEHADTASHLWRLARVIGRYREADRTPATEPPAATIQADGAIAEAVATSARVTVQTRIPKRASTEPLNDADLSVGDATDPEIATDLSVGDSTMPLDLKEVEKAEKSAAAKTIAAVTAAAARPAPTVPRNEFTAQESTMTLSPSDLKNLMVPPRLAPGAKGPPAPPPRPPAISPPLPGVTRPRGPTAVPPLPVTPRTKMPTATPPPAPLARAKTPTATPPLPGPRKAQASVRRAPLPTLPNRAFESPWEELAVAYEGMPVTDHASRLRWLYRASEVWETGGKDIVRAFDALARAFALARKVGDDAEVRARLHRLASEHRAWDRLADLYEGVAEQADSAQAAADLLMEVAGIRMEQKKPRDAEAQLRRILGMLPREPMARARLEELYRSEGRWVELAASLEERSDPRLGTSATESERPQLLRELAQMYLDKLARPHDAIDAFERLRALEPADASVLVRLADLYTSVGRWSKVIETLARLAEVGEDTPEARDALRRIAQINEQKLELPERALDAYNQIVATWPDDVEAWAALDRLYTANARWSELADVLRRRAALEREPAARAQLLARRAQVLLDHLELAEDAAAALRHARTIAPDDPQLADLMVTALVKAGREREGAAILEGRIDAMVAGGTAPRGELAALYIRLGQLRLAKLDDANGARTAIEHALALVPEHPTALAVLAELASPDDDPRAFADAKLREADSARDEDVQIAALMAAGDVLHTHAGDSAGARAAYERVLALRPYHADATWALAGMVEKGGDLDSASRVLEKRLEDESLTPPEKARLMTQLAALSRAAGVEPAAERRLLEALGCVPDHLPAIVALADFYADAERWNDLEMFLRESLDGTVLASAPAALIADLHRRLANAHEKLGRDEDAYQTLVAADRLHRGHLLIKLALGENRYKARRWREAALHLSPLATHEDAARYPSEVAQGLHHAALAEIRSLRPENAPALYARAVELKPNYGPALQALAELAMEKGDHKGAADLLTRQATATEDPGERLRLFEALGDMALMMLDDEARARTCYAAAVAAAQPLEAKHVALLEKLLARQDLANDHAGAGRTAELMAAFGGTPAERAARYVRAARDYLAAGDRVRARGAAARAVDADPYDVDAVDLASGLAIDQSDVEAAAAMLTRLLTAKDDRTGIPARKAVLSYRLGHARHQRGDARQAASAYERAIQIAPTSEGAISARRGLVELLRAGDDTAKKDAIAAHLQAIAAASGQLADLVAWADEARRTNNADAARTAFDVAAGCGQTLDVHQNAFLSIHKPYALRDDESYKATLAEADRALITDGEEATLGPIAAALAEAAALLWPDTDEALARAGCAGAKRVPATLKAPATAMYSRLTTVLGTGAVILYQRDEGPDVTVVAAATPVIVLGPRFTNPESGVAPSAVRAALARAIELTRPEHVVFAGMPIADATRLLASVIRLFGPAPLKEAASALVEDPDVQRVHDEMVKAALSVKIRGRLEQTLATTSVFVLDVRRHLAACERTADRAALLVDGDAKTIAEHATVRGSSAQHLIAAVAQPGWLALRARLGLGVR